MITIMSERKNQLKRLIATKKKALKAVPKGHLEISKSHGMEQAYYVVSEKGSKTKQYLTKDDEALLGALAQKSYDAAVLKRAEQELRAWEALAYLFPDMPPEDVYETLSPLRQKYVTPIQPSDEEYRKAWEALAYEPGAFREGAPEYITNRGERVRSKSEQLIANLLYYLGIPYRYEYPITIYVNGKRKTWRPDFTLLDVKNRKEYHLEHFGKMDDQSEENYARTALWKIKVYEENGYYEGKNMIYSFETSRVPPDMVYLERKLKRIFELN